MNARTILTFGLLSLAVLFTAAERERQRDHERIVALSQVAPFPPVQPSLPLPISSGKPPHICTLPPGPDLIVVTVPMVLDESR